MNHLNSNIHLIQLKFFDRIRLVQRIYRGIYINIQLKFMDIALHANGWRMIGRSVGPWSRDVCLCILLLLHFIYFYCFFSFFKFYFCLAAWSYYCSCTWCLLQTIFSSYSSLFQRNHMGMDAGMFQMVRSIFKMQQANAIYSGHQNKWWNLFKRENLPQPIILIALLDIDFFLEEDGKKSPSTLYYVENRNVALWNSQPNAWL